MLVRGEKPKREPLISVGLILPMDKQNSITIYNDLDQKRYFIESENDHLLVNGEKTENVTRRYGGHVSQAAQLKLR